MIKLETERRFLVKYAPDLSDYEKISICQGYFEYFVKEELIHINNLSINSPHIDRISKSGDIRIRIIDDNNAEANIKYGLGLNRVEVEWPITFNDSLKDLIGNEQKCIYKTRYCKISNDRTFFVDVYLKRYLGLIIGEIEYDNSDSSDKTIPDFFGREITGIIELSNRGLFLSDPISVKEKIRRIKNDNQN